MNDPVCVLLVEDNPADVLLFREAFLDAGLVGKLMVIDDGSQAIAYINSAREYSDWQVPDLAVLDLSLPKNDGIQILSALRSDERFSRVPVVVVSSSPYPPASLSEESLGVARYISKPLELEQFLQIGVTLMNILFEARSRRTGQ